MADTPLQYSLPTGTTSNAFKARLKTHLPLEDDAARTTRRTFFDSFDWRLFRAGGVLEEESGDQGSRLAWRTLGTAEVLASLHGKKTPRFVWDLPSGPLRHRLEPLLEMRCLLEQTTVRSRIHPMKWLNKDGKTILRLVIEDARVVEPRGKRSHSLGQYLRVMPIRGYDKPLKQCLKILQEDLILEPAGHDLMLTAFNKLGIQPGGYSSKLNIKLEPTMRAGEATRLVLLTLLDVLEKNEPGTKSDLDSEFLHDFRVSVRRTRSALSQIKGVLPVRILERFSPDFAWLGQVTGPTRDMDVYLLKFDDYRSSLPPEVREDLAPLHDFLVNHQKTEQGALAKQLISARYRKLVRDWRKYLQSPLPKRSTTPNANRPVLDVANERIWKVYRRAIKEGRAIGPETPAEHLHELRKTCKKLRYLMEFFQSLYPPSEIKALIKALKILQDNLGDFQDLEVQASNLRHFSEQMMNEGQVPPQTLMAMGILVNGLSKRQHAAREEFAARFAQFASNEHRREFARLFVPATPVAA